MMLSPLRLAAAGVLSISIAAAAPAALVGTYDVGSGARSATLQFDFENGNTHVATVRWNGSLDGFVALQMVAAAVPGGQLDFQSFSFGKFVTGIGVGGDYQYGEGDLWPVENWWHYWTADGAAGFTEAMFGASDRALVDGSRDAWVFGSSNAPVPVPMPGAAITLATLVTRRRRA